MFDPARIARATGWTVVHRTVVGSTNEEAARMRDAGAGPRIVLVADEQERGRGRAGRFFVSPPGGLYASLLVAAASEDLPGPLTAAVSLAAAEAAEAVAGGAVGIKWPNDLWVGRKKLAGILLDAAGEPTCVVAGIGLNLAAVPADLPADVRAQTTALDLVAGRAIDREALLIALLLGVDVRVADLRFPARRRALAAAWEARLLFVGEPILYEYGGRRRRGVLRGASLEEGLSVEDDEEGLVRRRAEHVRDVRPAP